MSSWQNVRRMEVRLNVGLKDIVPHSQLVRFGWVQAASYCFWPKTSLLALRQDWSPFRGYQGKKAPKKPDLNPATPPLVKANVSVYMGPMWLPCYFCSLSICIYIGLITMPWTREEKIFYITTYLKTKSFKTVQAKLCRKFNFNNYPQKSQISSHRLSNQP